MSESDFSEIWTLRTEKKNPLSISNAELFQNEFSQHLQQNKQNKCLSAISDVFLRPICSKKYHLLPCLSDYLNQYLHSQERCPEQLKHIHNIISLTSYLIEHNDTTDGTICQDWQNIGYHIIKNDLQKTIGAFTETLKKLPKPKANIMRLNTWKQDPLKTTYYFVFTNQDRIEFNQEKTNLISKLKEKFLNEEPSITIIPEDNKIKSMPNTKKHFEDNKRDNSTQDTATRDYIFGLKKLFEDLTKKTIQL